MAAGPTYSQVFGEWLCDIAEQDVRFVGITPRCAKARNGQRSKNASGPYFDVAIANTCRDVRCRPRLRRPRPVVAIYSTFLQRAYDQLIHDVALQRLRSFSRSTAGLVGGDGATHQACSISLTCAACRTCRHGTADENECRRCSTRSTLDQRRRRYPRGRGRASQSSGRCMSCRSVALKPGGRGARPRALASFDGDASGPGRRGARRDARQHALRQAARRGSRLLDRVEPLGNRTLEENAVAGEPGPRYSRCCSASAAGFPSFTSACPMDSSSTAPARTTWPLRDSTRRRYARPSSASGAVTASRAPCLPANQDRRGMISQ